MLRRNAAARRAVVGRECNKEDINDDDDDGGGARESEAGGMYLPECGLVIAALGLSFKYREKERASERASE